MLQSRVQVSEIRFADEPRSLLTGKKQGISPIQPFSVKIRLENICEYSYLRDEFPARQNRELIRDNMEAIPPYQAGTGN